MKLSEKRNIEKRKKFEKELRSELAKWNSARLKKATSNFVHYLNNEGTPRDFVNFILATKFGGQNALVALGVWKDFVIESFNQAWNLKEVKLNDQLNRRPWHFGGKIISGCKGINLFEPWVLTSTVSSFVSINEKYLIPFSSVSLNRSHVRQPASESLIPVVANKVRSRRS